MATVILIVAIAIETAFAAARWVMPSQPSWVRSALRIGMCGTLWLLTLTGIIPWSFRWYGLAGLLSAWALWEAWFLHRKQEAPQAVPPTRIVLQAGTAALLIFIAIIPALVFPPYELPEPTGQYAVATALRTFTDENRIEAYSASGVYRSVNVEFWYPQNADGVFPLVIFSHGGLGIRRSNLSLYHELASHGYVVGSIDHPYHAFWTQDVQGELTLMSWDYFGELMREDAQSDKQQSHTYYQRWMSTRMGDIDFVIDTVLAYAPAGAGVGSVYDLVDTDRIGVMGHSLGGAAALGIGRQRSDIGAVIALEAPFMVDIIGVEGDEFVFVDDAYPVPVLNVYSDSSWGHLTEWPQYARNAALLSDPQMNTFNAHIGGVGHLGLTDLAITSPFLVRLLDGIPAPRDGTEHLHTINRLCLEFLSEVMEHHGR
jgi:dienelactone hydrolase